MSVLNEIFGDRVFVINCAHRQDRMAHFDAMAKRHGFTYQRFEAHSGVVVDGRVNGNAGCTASHRGLLELCAHHRWPWTMIFEDDADIIYQDFNERLARAWRELPADWGLFYLGGGYAQPPIRRVSQRIIQVAGMMTTSSYAITWQQARKMAPYISGIGPIDSLFQGFNREAPSYCISPRCVVQYPNHSDLQERESANGQSMLDRALEANL